MYLVEILLPLYDNEKTPIGRAPFDQVRRELTERFGGVTAHLRAPAEGRWKESNGHVANDDVVIVEVMVEAIDHIWWSSYRSVLEQRFRQEAIVVRASVVELL